MRFGRIISSIVEQNIAILRLISRGIAEGRIGDRKIGGGAFLCNNTDGRRISFRGIMLYRTVRECAVLYADFLRTGGLVVKIQTNGNFVESSVFN